jgi:hypothetical protein
VDLQVSRTRYADSRAATIAPFGKLASRDPGARPYESIALNKAFNEGVGQLEKRGDQGKWHRQYWRCST